VRILTDIFDYKHDGVTESGPLLVDDTGISVGVVDRTEKKSFFRKLIIYKAGYYVGRWDDVVGYEISEPGQNMFFGSDITRKSAILTLKTANNQQRLKVNHFDQVSLRNALRPYLGKLDAGQGKKARRRSVANDL
jgi:hypothetical protein